MRIGVKICGITTVDDARVAIDAGADALGFVFAESPRRIDEDTARRLFDFVPPFVTTVAVLRYPSREEIERVFSWCTPDVVQAEPTSVVSNAVPAGTRLLPVFHEGEDDLSDIRERDRPGRSNPAVLLEASGRGGRGISPDWDVAAEIARDVRLVLAGGLRPDNVRRAICRVRPLAVDVSSGVEPSPGSKSPELIQEFFAEVRRAEEELKAEVKA
jgi:phosphoribosylanthranilate isomerase